jgi:pyrimidine-specific ribonucleoside hydrolase
MLFAILKRCIHLILLYVLTTAATYAAKPLIIDTDVGVDDVIAMLYLLQDPQIQIKAITITSNGNAHCKPALRNTLGLLRMMNQPSIPVSCGQENPLMGDHHFPAEILEESDNLAGAASLLPPPYPNLNKLTAVDLLIKTIKETPEPVTILAIGPLTNIAQALKKEPQIKKHIRAIYIMGGAIDVAGNIPEVIPTSENKSAEWNIYIDPLAAHMVMSQQQIPIILIPLDITNQLPINMEFYNTIKKNHQTPAATFVFTLLKNNLKMIRENGWYFWDPLAAVISSDESMVGFRTQHIKVLLTPETLSGATVVNHQDGYNLRIVTQVNQKRFKASLLNYLNKSQTV